MTMGHGARVELHNLGKTYGDTSVLRDVSLDLAPGEFMTFLGPSGSGKTTTLNIVAGFVTPDDGDVTVAGTPISKLPPHRRNIGMVFQNYALFPHMTVAGNVAFPLKQRRVDRRSISKAVGEILELVGLGNLAHRYPRELSGGQQQRVALARALVYEPQVLLLDEPLGALDKRLREGLQLEIMRIHRDLGITFIFVTHDQDEALMMSDRIAVFNHGEVKQVGTAEELYERPASLFVAEFLGNSNVLPGHLITSRGRSLFKSDGYELELSSTAAFDSHGSHALMVRPERIRLKHPQGVENLAGFNVLRGNVAQVIYMGGKRRVHVDVEGVEKRMVVDEPAAGSLLNEREQVLVCWAPNDGVLMSVEDAHPLAQDGVTNIGQTTPPISVKVGAPG
ncbi:ABC transporter ATP-binding protein [Arthrobacter sp. 2MCAF15]|uniref:ABC transporter ATP-binding protein n=1 Tax=Arthrobacter sp. 2MCAF15 TaxID=3232984 RepID=UPI003F907A15